MNKLIFLLSTVFFIFPFIVFSQKMFKPSLAIGLSKRMNSIRLNDVAFTSNKYELFTYNIGTKQTYFSLDIKNNIFNKNLILEFSNYFTYSEFRRVRPDRFSQIYTPESRLKHDHFLSLLYQFNSKNKKSHFLMGGGIGYMNLGTRFTYDIVKGFDNTGNPILLKNIKGTFSFFAPKLIFGIEKSNFNGYIIVNGTPDENYAKNPTIWIEFKSTYTINLFKEIKSK